MGYITRKKNGCQRAALGSGGSKLMFARETASDALTRSFLLPPYHVFPDSLEGRAEAACLGYPLFHASVLHRVSPTCTKPNIILSFLAGGKSLWPIF